MNTRLVSLRRLAPLLFVLACASFLMACASKPVARGYVRGDAGVQVFQDETFNAPPLTAPYTVHGDVNFMINPWRSPFITFDVLSPESVIRTSQNGVAGRLEGSGYFDNGRVLIIRP